MSSFVSFAQSAVRAARGGDCSVKLASLRDAISYALFNIPYSEAVFTERGGRLPPFDPLEPVFLSAAAARYGIAYEDLGRCRPRTWGTSVRCLAVQPTHQTPGQ